VKIIEQNFVRSHILKSTAQNKHKNIFYNKSGKPNDLSIRERVLVLSLYCF